MRQILKIGGPLLVVGVLLWPQNDEHRPRLLPAEPTLVESQSPPDSGDARDIQVYVRNEGKEPAHFEIDQLTPTKLPSRQSVGRWKVSAKQIQKTLAAAQLERVNRLRRFGRVPSQPAILPNGGLSRVWAIHMTLSDRMEPPLWGGAEPDRTSDIRQLNLIREVSQIGKNEGFAVTVRVDTQNVESISALQRQPGINLIEYEGPEDLWSQDSANVAVDHSVSVPASIGDHPFIVETVLRDRLRRLYRDASFPSERASSLLKKLIFQKYPVASYEVLGQVDELPSKAAAAAIAIANGTTVHENIAYVEGGDILSGIRPNGGQFAIVGRDSVAISSALLQRDLSHPVHEREVLETIAADLGVERVFPVELPGEFHLDMAALMVGPNRVILNDAEEAARLQESWLRADLQDTEDKSEAASQRAEETIRHIWERARWRSEAEARALADLHDAGLTVHRVAGIFHDGPVRMNLFNSVIATGSSGEVYAIVFGADPRAEAYFARKLLLETPSRLQRIYFMSRDFSIPSGTGGIKCRISTEGELVTSLAAIP